CESLVDGRAVVRRRDLFLVRLALAVQGGTDERLPRVAPIRMMTKASTRDGYLSSRTRDPVVRLRGAARYGVRPSRLRREPEAPPRARSLRSRRRPPAGLCPFAAAREAGAGRVGRTIRATPVGLRWSGREYRVPG